MPRCDDWARFGTPNPGCIETNDATMPTQSRERSVQGAEVSPDCFRRELTWKHGCGDSDTAVVRVGGRTTSARRLLS
jgi:hypothetical protein